MRSRVVPCLAGTLALAAGGLTAAAPASASTPKLGSRTLRSGMSGPDVRALQRDLDGAGFKVSATGTFGAGTAAQVRNFENFYDLPVNGAAGAGFVHTLRQVLALDAHQIGYGTETNVVGDTTSGGGGLGGSPVKIKKSKTARSAHTTTDPTGVLKSDPVLAPVKRNGGSAHLGNRVLRQGMSGHDVRVLQSYLTLAGYPTTVDGDFGPTTETNVVKWEQANDLAGNGVVTYGQSRVLREDVAKVISRSPTTKSPTSTTPTPVSTVSGGRATLNAGGTANAPADAPAVVQEMIQAANSINNKPYIYGGGHGKWNDAGYDCSGSVSFVLHAAGLLSESEDSGELESYGSAGPGNWVTIYANAGHTWIVIAGLAFDTAHYGPTTPGGTGPRWLTPVNATANLHDGTGGYVVRHPTGL